MKILRTLMAVLIALAGLAPTVHAADAPYDVSADARAEIRQALAQPAGSALPVLLVFGANWCGDCKVLDGAMKSGASAALMARDFKVVKIDVGRFDRNVDLADKYGVPLKQGIPAVAILSPKGELLYATRAGELADARHMGDAGIHDFFQRAAASAKTRP
jgi:protein disulfide-isomerase